MTDEPSPTKRALDLLKVWNAGGKGEDPVDPELLCNEVINKQSDGDTLTIMRDRFDGQFDGMMQFNPASRKGIAIINKSVSSIGRINFTTFHEIYHFLGHRNMQKSFSCSGRDLSDYKRMPLEVEANKFASHILVPRQIVRKSCGLDFKIDHVRELAHRLNASVEAVAYAWMEVSQRPLAFVKAQSGIIEMAFPNDQARRHQVFIERDRELPSDSITSQSIEDGRELCGEVSEGVWSKKFPAFESSYLGTDSWSYSFVEFIID